MSELAEILELLYTAGRKVESIRARLYERSDEQLYRKALSQEGLVSGESSVTSEAGSWLDDVRVVEKRTFFWAIPPTRLRWESKVYFDGRENVTDSGVKDGAHWWRMTPSGQIESSESNPSVRFFSVGFEHMLQPSRLLASVELVPEGQSEWQSRAALKVRGSLRANLTPDITLDELGWPATDYEMVVDSEHGILLRTIARYQGRIIKTRDFAEIAFDEVPPDDAFAPLSE